MRFNTNSEGFRRNKRKMAPFTVKRMKSTTIDEQKSGRLVDSGHLIELAPLVHESEDVFGFEEGSAEGFEAADLGRSEGVGVVTELVEEWGEELHPPREVAAHPPERAAVVRQRGHVRHQPQQGLNRRGSVTAADPRRLLFLSRRRHGRNREWSKRGSRRKTRRIIRWRNPTEGVQMLLNILFSPYGMTSSVTM